MKSRLFFRGTPLEDLIKIRQNGNSILSLELGRNLKFNTNLYSYKEHENTSSIRKDKDFPTELIDYIYDVIEARRTDQPEKLIEEIEGFRLNFSVALLLPKYINFQNNNETEYTPYISVDENTLFSKKKEVKLKKYTTVISGISFDFYVNQTNQIVLADIGTSLPPPPVLKINRIISRVKNQFSIFNHINPVRDISEIELTFNDNFTDSLLDNNMNIINGVYNSAKFSDIDKDIDSSYLFDDREKVNQLLIKLIQGIMNIQDAEAQMIHYSINTILNLPDNLTRRNFEKIIQEKLRISNFKRVELETDDTILILNINIKNFLRQNNILKV